MAVIKKKKKKTKGIIERKMKDIVRNMDKSQLFERIQKCPKGHQHCLYGSVKL